MLHDKLVEIYNQLDSVCAFLNSCDAKNKCSTCAFTATWARGQDGAPLFDFLIAGLRENAERYAGKRDFIDCMVHLCVDEERATQCVASCLIRDLRASGWICQGKIDAAGNVIYNRKQHKRLDQHIVNRGRKIHARVAELCRILAIIQSCGSELTKLQNMAKTVVESNSDITPGAAPSVILERVQGLSHDKGFRRRMEEIVDGFSSDGEMTETYVKRLMQVVLFDTKTGKMMTPDQVDGALQTMTGMSGGVGGGGGGGISGMMAGMVGGLG